MPKGKNSKRRGGGKVQEACALPGPHTTRNEDEGSLADNWSTQSVQSDDTSWHGSDPLHPEDDEQETTEQENFEDKFMECLDSTLVKSTQNRLNALKGIQRALQKKYVADFLLDRKETVTDNLMKCLKKGKGEEQALASSCLALMAVQLGPEAESILTNVQPTLSTILSDNASTAKARGACATSLAVMSLLSSYDLEATKAATKSFEDIFRLGYGQGENSPNVSPELSSLMSQALCAWCLLLTIVPQYEVQTHINKLVFVLSHLGHLQDLLENSNVDLRMAAGEAIALLYELARDSDEDFEHESEEALCELLKQLSTDSVKHRAKKDRRQQRSCFRDVQRYVVEYESPYEVVKLGKESQVEICSWSQKRQYDSFCYVLLSGTLVHMKANPVLREMFDLGPPGSDEFSTKSLSKAQRTFINAAAFKARTKIRQKHRDKRAVVMNGY